MLDLASAVAVSNSFAQYADYVVAYTAGAGVSASFTNPVTALGEPARVTGASGAAVTPFNPPFRSDQIVSIGAGGSLTLHLGQPIENDPGHAYGIDFLIFGNSGFVITNGNFSGGGITDGSLFGHNTGATRVSVSADGTNFYVLNPALAPTVDRLFPTDGSGNFLTPVDPRLSGANFAGASLASIRALYAASGGGSGFDLAWAQDTNGQDVVLSTASFVRIDVLSGKSEVDAVTVLPRQTIYEDFATNPLLRGWRIFGNTNLFRWNETNFYVEATWDSSQANSYLQYPLKTVLNRQDDFSIGFDLKLNDIAAGFDTNKPSTFPLAIGLQNNANATATNFFRSTGANSPNLVEFNFFPDTGYGPTVWPAVWSTNSSLSYRSSLDYTILDLPVGVTMRVRMSYTASNSTLVTTISTNGAPIGIVHPVTLSSTFTDFRVDTFAIESYAETRTAAAYGGSLLAHGIVDNIVLTLPPAPIQLHRGSIIAGQWQSSFLSRTNWQYVLEATGDLRTWSEVSGAIAGTGGPLTLRETNAPSATARFYRIKSQHSN